MSHAKKVGNDILDGKNVGFWDRLKYSDLVHFPHKHFRPKIRLTFLEVVYRPLEKLSFQFR